MLAVVRTPRTEISLHGDGAEAVLEWLKKKFHVELADVPQENDDELVDIAQTDLGRELDKMVLAGYRLKAGLTQKRLAELSGIRQTVISEYETGKRVLTMAAAKKLAPHLNVDPGRLVP